ncbi:MAG: aquaporin [Thermoplasmata archaeon]|nr:aquaporin [Thermoplasmata archaeon]
MAWNAGQKYLAEFLGTFGLLLIGGGAAVFSGTFSGFDPNARVVLVSAAVGLTVMGGAYAFGEISGGHFNPAVTLSMALSKRMPIRDVPGYLLAQVTGGIVGIAVVLGIAAGGSSDQYNFAQGGALGSQCYAGFSAPLPPCYYSLGSVFLLEVVLTFVFVLVIHLVTRPENGAKNLAPLAIGLTLVVANLIAINVDGASLNPVRSFSPALVSSVWSSAQWAIKESWLFWVAPILGGLLASVVERAFRPSPG